MPSKSIRCRLFLREVRLRCTRLRTPTRSRCARSDHLARLGSGAASRWARPCFPSRPGPAILRQRRHRPGRLRFDGRVHARTIAPGRWTRPRRRSRTVLKTVPAVHPRRVCWSSARAAWTRSGSIPLGPRNDAALMRRLDRVQPGGGTPLGSYIKKGADRLLAERAAAVRLRHLPLADGHRWRSPGPGPGQPVHAGDHGPRHHHGRDRRGHEQRPHARHQRPFLPARQ